MDTKQALTTARSALYGIAKTYDDAELRQRAHEAYELTGAALPSDAAQAPSSDGLDADIRRQLNDELCEFAMRWTLDGDYLRCTKCKRAHIASKADMDFAHQAGCKYAATSEPRPWRALLSILSPLYAAPVAPAAAAPEQVGKNALVLTGAQLLEALDFIAPDRATDPEQMEATVAIEYGKGHGGEAMYVWCAEYPEEGSFVLDGKSAEVDTAPPTPLAAAGRTFDYDDVVSTCDAHGICLPVDCIETVVEIVKLSGLLSTTHGDKQS